MEQSTEQTEQKKQRLNALLKEVENLHVAGAPLMSPESQRLVTLLDEVEKLRSELMPKLTRLTISTENRMPELEEKFNIHPGQAYRVILRGMNPACHLTYDGILKGVTADFSDKGFTIRNVCLEDGLMFTEWFPKEPFDKVSVGRGDGISGFGRIIDEQGFLRVREGKKKELGGNYNAGNNSNGVGNNPGSNP
jgi:hypothetical protein